ncbi:MAG: hypothetical protein AAFN93_06140 [Bacteroidota bacterium]
MRYLICLFALCLSVLFISCSAGTSSSSEDSSTTNQGELAEETPMEEVATASNETPELIAFNPSYTWEEFAISSAADVFSESELNDYGIWNFDDQSYPVIILISDQNEFVVLSESDDELDEGAFKVTPLNLPETSGFVKAATLSYGYYEFFSKDINGDGTDEYVISAEVSGMAGTDDGMRSVNYIKSAVFSRQDYSISYSQEMSDQYNEEVGTKEDYVNESMVDLISKKYYNLHTKPDGLEKTAMMRSLIEDMGIVATTRDDETAFGKVDKTDEGYVIYVSFVGTRYFITSPTNTLPALKTVDSDFYPLMIDEYQMTDIYSFISARVDDGEVQMLLDSRPESESATGTLSLNFTHNGEHWILSDDGAKWLQEGVRKGLERIQDE